MAGNFLSFVNSQSRPKFVSLLHHSWWLYPQGLVGHPGFHVPPHGHMSRNAPPLTHSGWMNRPSGGGRPAEPPQSRGMNDVFVTDNGFRPSGPRFDEFGTGAMPTDRRSFGLR